MEAFDQNMCPEDYPYAYAKVATNLNNVDEYSPGGMCCDKTPVQVSAGSQWKTCPSDGKSLACPNYEQNNLNLEHGNLNSYQLALYAHSHGPKTRPCSDNGPY
jgi:hypothetical protein